LLHLGFTRKINPNRPGALDWEFYANSYPGLNLKSQKDAVRHWKRHGSREGRVGSRMLFPDQKLES